MQITDIGKYNTDDPEHLSAFLTGRSEYTLMLYDHSLVEVHKISPVIIHPAKTITGIANAHKRVAHITQLGRTLSIYYFH